MSYNIHTRITAIGCLTALMIGYSSSLSVFLNKHLPLKDILYNNKYISSPYFTYQDLFPSEYETQSSIVEESEFESDLPEVEEHDDTLYENSHIQDMKLTHSLTNEFKKENIKSYYDTNIITLNIPQTFSKVKVIPKKMTNVSVDLQEITLNIPQPSKQEIILNIPQSSKDNVVHSTSYMPQASYFNFSKPKTESDNIYMLPISDAINIQSAHYNKQKNNLTQDMANIYQKRRKQTLMIRDNYHLASQDIHKLQRILKILGVSLENKFYASKYNNISTSLLKTLQISQDEIMWRYPEFYTRLQDIQALRVALTFVPTHPPVKAGRRSSTFGWRQDPFTKRSKFHSGMDYAAPLGTSIYATASGTVRFAGWKGGYGNVIDIYHGNGIVTRYAHLSKIFVTRGSKIMRGSAIGAMGSTGRSTGSHLHYEIKINGKTINPDNFTSKNISINKIINKY